MKTVATDKQIRDAFSLSPKRIPRVLIWGLGVHGGGEGVLRFFHELGWKITVHDPKSKEIFAETQKSFSKSQAIAWKLGTPWNDDLLHTIDLLIKNPGVPLTHAGLKAAKKLGIPVTNDADIFTRVMPPNRIIGVTGTKGKTTTATLIAHILGDRAVVVGTPKKPFLSALKSKANFVVAEYSSFDCDLLTRSPHLSILTSLFADHLNRYASFDDYAYAKTNLWKFQTASDMLIHSDGVTKKYLKVGDGKKILAPQLSTSLRASLSFSVHEEAARIAVMVARSLGVTLTDITKRVKTYRGEEGRREHVPAVMLECYNDTTATNPLAAVSSITALHHHFPKRPHAVIVGGEDKTFPDKDVREFAHALKRINTVYILPGSLSDRLHAHLTKQKNVHRVKNISEAVAHAVNAIPGGVLLLSPGAASFNMYAHEFARGQDFVRSVITHAHGTLPRRGR